jgi:hypothetical protein
MATLYQNCTCVRAAASDVLHRSQPPALRPQSVGGGSRQLIETRPIGDETDWRAARARISASLPPRCAHRRRSESRAPQRVEARECPLRSRRATRAPVRAWSKPPDYRGEAEGICGSEGSRVRTTVWTAARRPANGGSRSRAASWGCVPLAGKGGGNIDDDRESDERLVDETQFAPAPDAHEQPGERELSLRSGDGHVCKRGRKAPFRRTGESE